MIDKNRINVQYKNNIHINRRNHTMYGNMGNMQAMMKKVQKMQAEMVKMQNELKKRTIEVSAGGGAVKIVINGEKQIQSINFNRDMIDAEDLEMLEDLVAAAVNEAIHKVDDMMAKEMSKITGGMGLPPGLF